MLKKTKHNQTKGGAKENFSDKVLNAYYQKRDEHGVHHNKMNSSAKHESKSNYNNNSLENERHINERIHLKNKKQPIIISVGGGKGGIGKSFLSANIAVRLALLGFKVSAIDLDLGAANLHTCLGIPSPTKSVSNFFQGDTETLEETGMDSGVPNLTLYGGNQDFWQHVKPHGSQKIKLINYLQELDADYVLLDLGAGTHVHTLDFFIFSDAGLLVVVPEPTSIENAYVFMKSVMYRKVQNICRAFGVREDIESQLLQRIVAPVSGSTPFKEFKNFIESNKEIDKEIIEILQATNIGIVMNQVRTQDDRDLGLSMSSICSQYFGFSSQYLGAMRYDDAAWKSIRIRKPLILDYPQSVASANIYEITDELVRLYESLRKENNNN